MKKCFLLLCAMLLWGQSSFGNIIIDLDVKLNDVVPVNNPFQCGSGGCNFNWVDNGQIWMAIVDYKGNYFPYMFFMRPGSSPSNRKIELHEADSSNPIEGVRIVPPTQNCNALYDDFIGYFRLLNCASLLELARVSFSMEGNVLNVSITSNFEGTLLKKVDPIVNYDFTSNHPNKTPIGEALLDDRTTPSTNALASTAIFPNPFSQSINITTTTSASDQVRIQLLHSNGQTLDSQTYPGGQSTYQFPTGGCPPGFYLLQVQTADRNEVYPVIKTQ